MSSAEVKNGKKHVVIIGAGAAGMVSDPTLSPSVSMLMENSHVLQRLLSTKINTKSQ